MSSKPKINVRIKRRGPSARSVVSRNYGRPNTFNKVLPNVHTQEIPSSVEGKEYALSLLHPEHVSAVVPDNTIRPRALMRTILRQSITSTVDAKDGNYYSVCQVSPYGKSKLTVGINFGTATAGVPGSYALTNDNGYSTWSTTVDQIRPVSMVATVRPVTALANVQGFAGMLRQQFAIPGGIDSVAVSTYFATQSAKVFPLGSINGAFKITFLPLNEEDTEWVPYNKEWDTDKTTILTFFTSSTTAQQYELEIITNYEFLPLLSAQPLFNAKVMLGSQGATSQALLSALQRHNINEDDRYLVSNTQTDTELFSADMKSMGRIIRRTARRAMEFAGNALLGYFGLSDKALRLLDSEFGTPEVLEEAIRLVQERRRQTSLEEVKSDISVISHTSVRKK